MKTNEREDVGNEGGGGGSGNKKGNGGRGGREVGKKRELEGKRGGADKRGALEMSEARVEPILTR